MCNKHGGYIGMSVNTTHTFNRAFQMLCKYEKLGLDRLFTHRTALQTLGKVIMVGGKNPDYMKASWISVNKKIKGL